ncbi:COG4223 family protein, partial [Paracoccus thiocyanatus]
EPPAALVGDVPTLAQLRTSFPAAAREGLAAALKDAPQNQGALGTIGSFLRVQTGARSVEPRQGGDPDAILSRADAAVNAGDIKGALGEIAALPQSGQAAMAGWTTGAQAWVEANAALAAMAAGSM